MDFTQAFILMGLFGLLALLFVNILVDHYDRQASRARIHGLLQENRRLRKQLADASQMLADRVP
jgi:hypothetical protein